VSIPVRLDGLKSEEDAEEEERRRSLCNPTTGEDPKPNLYGIALFISNVILIVDIVK